MPEQMSENFKASFLLIFTKELIENTEAYKNLKIKNEVKEFIIKEKTRPELIEKMRPELIEKMRPELIEKMNPELVEEIKEKREEIKGIIKEKIKKEDEKISEMKKVGLLPEIRMILKPMKKPLEKLVQMQTRTKKIPSVLRIPEPALPETVSYLKPTPTSEKIDLLKLNILVKDPLVKIIECNGPNENVLVMGMIGRKPTPIKLSKEEINEILERFSGTSKIPLHEGLFKAAVGNLVISAVISEIAGIKFVIRKISYGF